MALNISSSNRSFTSEPLEPRYAMGIIAVTISSLVIGLALYALAIFLLLHGKHGRQILNQLAASCVLAFVPMCIFYHTGSIHLRMMERPMSLSYCHFWLHICYFTQFVIPYTLLMFSIERLMYIRDPTGHAQRMNRASHVVLIAFPWVIATVMAVIDNNVIMDRIVTIRTASNIEICFKQNMDYAPGLDFMIRVVLADLIPLLMCFIITIVVLVMWCFFKRKHALGRDYAMMGEQVEVNVRNSVIAVSVLNFLYIVVFIMETAGRRSIGLHLVIISLFSLIQLVVWITTITEVRNKFTSLFSCCRKEGLPETAHVTYSANGVGTP